MDNIEGTRQPVAAPKTRTRLVSTTADIHHEEHEEADSQRVPRGQITCSKNKKARTCNAMNVGTQYFSLRSSFLCVVPLFEVAVG